MIAEKGPIARMIGSPEGKFSFEHTVVGLLYRTLAKVRDGIVRLNLTSGDIDGARRLSRALVRAQLRRGGLHPQRRG